MALNLDSEPVLITCPHCTHRFEETISRLKYHPKHSCPSCKKYVGINLLALHTALESSRKSMDDLLERLLNSRK
jgi:Zn finger protein HypA/HybF involved in hydrogenase expression